MINFGSSRETFKSINGTDVKFVDVLTGAQNYIYSRVSKGTIKAQDADDVLSDTSSKLVKSCLTYDENRAKPQVFGAIVAESCTKDFYRPKRVETTTLSDECYWEDSYEKAEQRTFGSYNGDEFEADRELAYKEALSLVDKWTKGLSERNRTIIELTAIGYKPGEIAKKLGITQNAVSMFLSHFRAAHAAEYKRFLAA